MENMDAKEDLSYQDYPYQDFGNIRKSYPEQEDQDVRGAMEPSYRGRSYLGERRRIEDNISMFLFRSIQISGTRFILRG
jgi:hypothetical protein